MRPKPVDPDALTPREIEVVQQIALGIDNKQIAQKLFISERTVINHISHIFNKLSLTRRVQLVVYAYKNRLV
jgi:two-component system NarL family response regulator